MVPKGSGACKYPGISPNFDSKEHDYPKGGGIDNQSAPHPLANINPFRENRNPATFGINMQFADEILPH